MLRAWNRYGGCGAARQSHLMRCDDGYYYVVKFQNNPQHRRILVNELLGTRLAARLGLPTVPVEIVDVSEELIRLTPELAVELRARGFPVSPGCSSAPAIPEIRGSSRCMISSRRAVARGGKPARFRRDAGLRQMDVPTPTAARLFFSTTRAKPRSRRPRATRRRMIDQGFCFNAGEWNFPDAPLRGLYARNRVYQGVTGMESFAPWLERIEKQMTGAPWMRSSGRFPRSGTPTITTRCWRSSNNCTAAATACRT